MRQPFDDSIGHLSKAEWESTPTSVQQLVGNLLERVAGLEQQIGELRQDNEQLHSENQRLTTENQQLREQVERNWQNSSQPPSQDIARGFKGKEKGKSGRQRGGQAGHPGHERNLYPLEACASVENHYPSHCIACGHELSGEDAQPLRIQIVEIPPLTPIVREHRFHARVCGCCGEGTRAFDETIAMVEAMEND